MDYNQDGETSMFQFRSAENFYSKYEQQNLLAKIFVPLWSKLFSQSEEVGFPVQGIKKKCVLWPVDQQL